MPTSATVKQAREPQPPPPLEALLRRPDIWRGHSQVFVPRPVHDSGHELLNQALLHRGWPAGGLIEACQHFHASEWWLFQPCLARLSQQAAGHLALINPPALPFLCGLAQRGVSHHNLLIIEARNSAEFIRSFREVCQSSAFRAVLAWQSGSLCLNYPQLRKLQLSSAEGSGLYVLFRPAAARQQSSPATLRLWLTPQREALGVSIFKQRGQNLERHLALPIPEVWRAYPSHKTLDHAPGPLRQADA